MFNDLVQVAPAVIFMLPVLIALAQFLKTYQYIPDRWIPLSVLVMATVGALGLTDLGLGQAIFQGIAVGLLAIGTFSGVRATVQG